MRLQLEDQQLESNISTLRELENTEQSLRLAESALTERDSESRLQNQMLILQKHRVSFHQIDFKRELPNRQNFMYGVGIFVLIDIL